MQFVESDDEHEAVSPIILWTSQDDPTSESDNLPLTSIFKKTKHNKPALIIKNGRPFVWYVLSLIWPF